MLNVRDGPEATQLSVASSERKTADERRCHKTEVSEPGQTIPVLQTLPDAGLRPWMSFQATRCW